MRSAKLAIFFFLCVAPVSGAFAAITKEQALAVIRNAQNQLQSAALHLKAIGEEGRSDDPAEQQTFSAVGLVGGGITPRYRLSCEFQTTHFEKADGPSIEASGPDKCDVSSDATCGMAIQYLGGKAMSGIIAAGSTPHATTPVFNQKLGMTTFFYREKGLSAFLQELPEQVAWQVLHSDDPNMLVIAHKDPLGLDDAVFARITDVLYLDLSKGANIARFERWSCFGQKDASMYYIGTASLVQVDGVWVPEAFDLQTGSWNPQTKEWRGARVLLSTFSWNAINEPVSPEDFRLVFPPGLTVQDRIAGVYYKQGLPSKDYELALLNAEIEYEKENETLTSNTSSIPTAIPKDAPQSAALAGKAMIVLLVALSALASIVFFVIIRHRMQRGRADDSV